MQNKELDTFDSLVSWATWQVIEGISKGEKLRSVVFGVLMVASQWHTDQRQKIIAEKNFKE